MKLEYLSGLNNLKRKHPYILLAAIVILGFAIRYVPSPHKLIMDDPYYQYTIAKSILKDGHTPERLPLAFYPHGKGLRGAPIFLPYFIAYTYRIIQPLGVSLMDYMIIFPAIFGALAAIPFYFLAEQLFDKRIALVSAFIYVILPASIERTFAGYADKESLATILIFIWLYLFVRSSKELNLGDRRSLLLPILSGVFMGLSFLTWRGAAYFALLIALSVFIQTLIKPDKGLAYSIAIMSFFGFATMHLFQPFAYPLQNFLFQYRYAALTYVSILAVAAILPEHVERVFKKKTKSIHFIGLFLGLLVLSILLLNLQDRVLGMVTYMIGEFSGKKTPPLIFEAQRLTSAGYTISRNPFSLLVFFIPIGLYYFLKKSKGSVRFDHLFVLVWITTAAYGAYLLVRLFFNLAPIASMFIAYAFFGLADPLLNQIKLDEHLKGKKEAPMAGKGVPSPRLKASILIIIISLSILATVVADVQFAGDIKEGYSDLYHWEDAITYVRDNTPEDSVMIAFWDYGYMIQGLGERATIVDPGGGFPRRIDVAKMFTSPEDEALKIIKKYNPKDKPVYVLVSISEIFLQGVIRETARDDDLDIRVIFNIPKSADRRQDLSTLLNILSEKRTTIFWRNYPPGDYYTLIYLPNLDNPETENNLLPQLLPFYEIHEVERLRPFGFGARLNHFQLVWDNEYVYIYRIV